MVAGAGAISDRPAGVTRLRLASEVGREGVPVPVRRVLQVPAVVFGHWRPRRRLLVSEPTAYLFLEPVQGGFMDQTLQALTALAAGDVPPQARYEARRRILDTTAIGVAGASEPASRIAREVALEHPSAVTGGAVVFGTDRCVATDQAAFANATMMHAHDFMDTYLSPSGEVCHPADALPGLLALAQHEGLSVDHLLDAIVVAYEVACRLCDAGPIRRRGWDSAIYIGIAAAAGAARLLGLPSRETSEAISLTTIPNAALRQTRVDRISMWKSSAPANAVRNALHAVQLARRGFAGPDQPFSGRNGFEAQVSGPLDPEALVPAGEPPFIERTHIKSWPAQFNTQTGIEAAIGLRDQIGQLERLKTVRITTSAIGHALSADTAEKWAPATRETADHSLPYLVVSALIDGDITHASFTPELLQQQQRRDLLARVEVDVDDAFTAAYPGLLTVAIAATLTDGQLLRRSVDLPPGHADRPLSDDGLADKARRVLEPFLDRRDVDRHIDRTLNLDGDAPAGALLRHLVTAGPDRGTTS